MCMTRLLFGIYRAARHMDGERSMPPLIELEYRRPGKATTVYREWLVFERPDVKVLLLDAYEGSTVSAGGAVIQDTGAPIVWFVFPDRWYDIGRFHTSGESFTGWYTNLCKPPECHGTHWIARDLFLDCWQPVEGAAMWLDEDELAQAVHAKLIDRPTLRRIENERRLLELQLREGAWPPAIAQDMDLAHARHLMTL
jgi:predicted RNA-binding protein associated with RNAse of E/G family